MVYKIARRTAFIVWWVAAAGLQGCASNPRASVSNDRWLTGKGFATRSDWSSTALHLRRQQMRNTVRISQLLRRVPRVRLQPSPENPLGLTRVLGGDEGTCVLHVYLNGLRLAPRDTGERIDLDARVGVPDLDALELHLGTEGPVLDPDGCGSLLLWDQSMKHVGDPDFVGSITGRLEGDLPDAPVHVQLRPDGPMLRVEASGRFSFAGLLPGAYQLEFTVEGRPVALHTARVYANSESLVDVRVQSRARPATASF